MDAAAAEEGGAPLRTRHIKKRALKNKALSVSFDEKDLKDFVGGFHKRKKKRRKEALIQQEEAGRRKRIELRKKRKLDREFVQFGGAQPDSGTGEATKSDEELEVDEDIEPVPSVSGTMMYDNDNVQVIVTTSEISRDEVLPADKPDVGRAPATQESEMRKQKTVVSKKKPLKKAPMKRSRPKTLTKRDKRKGNTKKNTKH